LDFPKFKVPLYAHPTNRYNISLEGQHQFKNNQEKQSIDLTLYSSIPTKLHYQKEVEIYQSLPLAQIVLSQFLIPQLFAVFDVFSRRAFGQQVVQSSHI
jgi:hypothetical protein